MDLMVHGDVKYNHHHGHETGSDWAASVKLAKVGDEVKMRRYQIIVVSSSIATPSSLFALDDANRTLPRTFEQDRVGVDVVQVVQQLDCNGG